MSTPIGFREANAILGRPPGMSEEECSSLEVFRDGQIVVSRWQFTDEELEELKRTGGKCYLLLWGFTMQPATITPLSPFAPRPAL